MFSGIVQKKGKIVHHDLEDKWGKIVLETDAWERPLEIGESIAIQGICLTLTKIDGPQLHFDVLRETFDRTNLGEKAVGLFLNMERSLRWGDTMGGHIVIGHVDGVGHVKSIRQVGRDWAFEFTCNQSLMSGMVYKGSVSVDGVSLTIAELTDDSFTIHIIPFTYEHTTFGDFKVGDAVNLEVDLLGKFVRRLVESGQFPGQITWEMLRETGLIEEPVSPDESSDLC